MPSPGYLRLHESEELQRRCSALYELLSPCRLCPRRCGARRGEGETGLCSASTLRVARATAHHGEEPPVSGTSGSGTIFFSHCSLQCCYCQNHQISQSGLGTDTSVAGLADMMLDLQQRGCHNINLVSASHFLPFVVEALDRAAGQGLRLPIVFNSSGYEDVDVLQLLEGIVDIYLPDARYGDDGPARQLSGVTGYTAVNQATLAEMLRQVGHLDVDGSGIARQGLIVRHLVLPGGLSGTEVVLAMLRQTLGRHLALSLMGQYVPCFRADTVPALRCRLSPAEYVAARTIMEDLGFERGWVQPPAECDDSFVPDFTKCGTWN